MINPIKLYRQSQEAQLTWIRNHPVQYVVVNVVLGVVFIGYLELKDRHEMRKFEQEIETAQKVK